MILQIKHNIIIDSPLNGRQYKEYMLVNARRMQISFVSHGNLWCTDIDEAT